MNLTRISSWQRIQSARTGALRLAALVLAGALAQPAHAVLPLPTGATAAPAGAGTSAAFPKRLTAVGSTFGIWDSGTINPNYGRTGYYGTTSVSGSGGTGITSLLEFDAAGNTTRRISPLQLGVQVVQSDANRFYAQLMQTGASDVTIGAYNSSNNAPIFQHRIAADPSKTGAVFYGATGRVILYQNKNTTIELTVFNSDGVLQWARSLSSASFGSTIGYQLLFVLPQPDNSIFLQVNKQSISFTTGSFTLDSFLIKLTSTGSIEWAKKVNGSGIAQFISIPSATGTFPFYVSGFDVSSTGTLSNSSVSKLNANGTFAWSKRINGASLMTAGGTLTDDKVLLTGYVPNQNITGASSLAVLSSSGVLEAQTQFSFGVRNSTVAFPEGSRIWIATCSGAAADDNGPAYVGLADPTLTNIKWRKYKSNVTSAVASPDFDSDDVAASFFINSDHAIEVMNFRDDFAGSVNSTLLPEVSVSATSPGLSISEAGITLTDIAVTASTITPTLLAGNLTFESYTTNETSTGAGSGGGGTTPVSIATQPVAVSATPSTAATFSVGINNPSSLAVTYEWRLNGVAVAGATSASYTIPSVQPIHVGLYTVAVTSNGTTLVSNAALLTLVPNTRPVGNAVLFASDITHPNGNVYDQFLMTGASATVTADAGQIARISFIDLNDDIVQLEFSGAGTMTLTLANPTGPAVAVNYNQPTVSYMKGHATITLTGVDQTTNFGMYSVGSATGNVAVLKAGVVYDGFADVALVNVNSSNGQFGGIRIGNTQFFAVSGNTGIYAPGVNFTGPVNLYDIDARDNASPKLLTGTVAGGLRITGGNLLQTNGRAIEFGQATSVQMTAGTRSDGTLLPGQVNQGRLERNGVDVTTSVVTGP